MKNNKRSESPVVKRSLRVNLQKPIYSERKSSRNLNNKTKTEKEVVTVTSKPSRKKGTTNDSNKITQQQIENSKTELELEKLYSQKSEQLSFVLNEINSKVSSQQAQDNINIIES